MNHWATVNHHQLPKETQLGPTTTGSWCLRKAPSWSPAISHFNNIRSALSSFTKEGPSKYLQVHLPYHLQVCLELFPGQDADQGFDNSKAVGALGHLPPRWQLCLIVSPCSHLLLMSYSQTADLPWSSPPPSSMLPQHLPAARDAGSRAGILSVIVE